MRLVLEKTTRATNEAFGHLTLWCSSRQWSVAEFESRSESRRLLSSEPAARYQKLQKLLRKKGLDSPR